MTTSGFIKYIDEYRDAALAKGLLHKISELVEKIDRPLTFMEICGSHTHALSRFGIRQLLPENIRLISGPGCPVCVTSVQDVDAALYLAGQDGVIFATFGDMLRVPGTGTASLQKQRAAGVDVRIISSPMDIVALAQAHPERQVVFMGIGFETTAPAVAASIMAARKKKIGNLRLFSVHKIVPPAIDALLSDPLLRLDGFICPGHVSVIIGADAYNAITAAGKAAVITGFEPVDILEGILMMIRQCLTEKYTVEIQYGRGVKREGNLKARQVMNDVFEAADGYWRGLGIIPGSGLALRRDYARFDVHGYFDILVFDSTEPKGCACGDILRGIKAPEGCPLFRRVCTPLNPIGPCMVSSEGTCAAYYKYH
ncbi:MAG: hydrogenase formation protein HypD [Syntrophales bacterium]|nr:hydrogenase formation protein HypD [Syntrophales bacterium]